MRLQQLSCLLAGLTIAGSCLAKDASNDQGIYAGLFGGLGTAGSASLQQKGAVHLLPTRFKLPIDASGYTDTPQVALGGVQIGYDWNRHTPSSAWSLKPAAELEGIYLGKHTPVGTMPVTPRALGTQYVSIPTTAGILLANAVLTIQTPYSDRILPYIGAGAGIAMVSIKGADSANPSEPGINHFNSDPDARDSALALQFKAGIKAAVQKNLYLFAEYRYLSINATRYTFGATDYPGQHLPTDSWDVRLGRQHYNLFVAGLQYQF